MPEPPLNTNIGLYRSGVTSPERLRRTSVGRQHLLDNAIESLRNSLGRKSKHHMLFIGPRGIGKTHLLSCIEDAVRSDKALSARAVVVRFPEESNRTRSFADFLIGLCRILKDVFENEPIWSDLFTDVETEEDNDTVVDTLVPAIRQQNRRCNRTMLVMLENLGEIFARQIRSKDDIASLRKFLMADNGCLLLATAPMHFDGITDIRQPFYDFFDIQILDNLSFEESVEVIRLNLQWDERKDILDTFDDLRPRFQALYRMTGGNPRLTMMLYELIAHESVTGVQDQFHLLLDRISPFYQGRLNDLPPGQRALLECLAGMRDQEKTPAAIAARMRMSQQETSSLLKRLSDAHYLRSTQNPRDKRSHLYTIREGFFDIWLAMNHSRSTRKRLPFLLKFFNLFYPSIDAREEKRRLLRGKVVQDGNFDAEKALDYLSEIGDAKEKAIAKFSMARLYASRGVAEQVVNYILEAAPLAGDAVSQSIARIITSTPSARDYLSEVEEMIACWEMHRSGELEEFAYRLTEMGKTLTLRTFSETKLSFLQDSLESMGDGKERIRQRLRIAAILKELARLEGSEDQLRPALAEATAIADAGLIAWASNDLAALLHDTQGIGEAEPILRRALDISEAAYGKQHQILSPLLNKLAFLLHDANRNEEAETLLRRALEVDEVSFGNEHSNMAIVLNNLAIFLHRTNRIEEAESLLRRALAINESAFGAQHRTMAPILSNLARLHRDTNRMEEAEQLARRALEIDEAAFGTQHPIVAADLINLSILLHGTKREEDAKLLMKRMVNVLESLGLESGNARPQSYRVSLGDKILQRPMGTFDLDQ